MVHLLLFQQLLSYCHGGRFSVIGPSRPDWLGCAVLLRIPSPGLLQVPLPKDKACIRFRN